MINSFGDSTPLPSVMTEGFFPPYAGPVWEGSYVEIDTRYEGEPKDVSVVPFQVDAYKVSGSDKYKVYANGGLVIKHWTTDTVTPTSLETEGTLGTSVWINVQIGSGGSIDSASIESGTFPGSIIGTTDGDGNFLQSACNAVLARFIDDRLIQISRSDIRLLPTVSGSEGVFIAPSPSV